MSANVAAQPGQAGFITIENSPGGGAAMAQQGGESMGKGASAGLAGAGGDGGPITITRRILVSIQGSRLDFSQDGQGCATWRPVEGKQASIWGLHDVSALAGSFGADTAASASSLLQDAHVKSITRLEQIWTGPMEIGITIQGVQSKEVTGFGEEYCFTVLPESTNMVPMKVYEADESSADGIRWRQEYPKYKKANIDKHGILETGDLAYLFVHQTHPAIALLRANKDLLGSDIDAQQKIDNEWYKVQKETFTACCNTLKTKVLSKVSTVDLNNFSVEVSPIGTRDWLDIQDGEGALASYQAPAGATREEIAAGEAKHLEAYCEKRCSYHARFEITFEVNP